MKLLGERDEMPGFDHGKEKCTSAMELNELSDRAFREYTYAVAARKTDITAVILHNGQCVYGMI